MANRMKNFKVIVRITNMFGVSEERTWIIPATTHKSAQSKAYAKIGNQTGEIVTITEAA